MSSWASDLSGPWVCRLDPDDVGEHNLWFDQRLIPEHTVSLPGSIQEQGIGDEVTLGTPWVGNIIDRSFFEDEKYARYREPGNISVPFWLQPRVYYRGAVWYQREIDVPEAWAGRRVVLGLERVHWESTAWLDGRRVGAERSLSTPHTHDLGVLAPGKHLSTLRIDNRMIVDVGPNAHGVTDHTQGSWNGAVGRLSLTALSAVTINRVRVEPDPANGRVRAKVDFTSSTAGAGVGQVCVSARALNDTAVIGSAVATFDEDFGEDLSLRGLSSTGGHVDIELQLGAAARIWDEFSPNLYELDVTLTTTVDGSEHGDSTTVGFGLRTIATDGPQLLINDRPSFLRGTLESCVFPLTGHPPTDVASWRRIIDICRSHGLNLLRFHSWCPPEAAFRAADESGFYFQVEAPVWANQGAALGESRPIDDYVHEETRRILDAYGNHPSFIMMAHGNEPGGRHEEYLASWLLRWRSYDARRLFTSGAGWPVLDENHYHNDFHPRAHLWGEGLTSRLNATPPETCTDYSSWVEQAGRPIVSHEIGQWCAYPDFSEVAGYTGLMQPRNYGIFADFLREGGMAEQAEDFLHASGRLQVLCYKEDIESALRTEGFGGFHLLGLSDFPGQGTALVGVLNAFWGSKPYCSPEEFSRFCGPTVPLARLPRRIVKAGDDIIVEFQVAHFGAAPLRGDVTWSLRTSAGVDVLSGIVARNAPIAVGNHNRWGETAIPAPRSAGAVQYSLVLGVSAEDGRSFENDWGVWVMPADQKELSAAVHVTTDVQDAVARCHAGDDVLLHVLPRDIGNDVALGFTTVFWNTAWTRGQAPHTLGLLHDATHPMFAEFPTTGTTDWQWWELIQGAKAMLTDALPTPLRPVVQPIDTWFEARPLGCLVEARVGAGRIVVTSLSIETDPHSERLAALQFTHSLLDYMSGEHFEPLHTINEAQILSLLR